MIRHFKLLKLFKAFCYKTGAPHVISCSCVEVTESFSLSNKASVTASILVTISIFFFTANFFSNEPLKKLGAKPALSNENRF